MTFKLYQTSVQVLQKKNIFEYCLFCVNCWQRRVCLFRCTVTTILSVELIAWPVIPSIFPLSVVNVSLSVHVVCSNRLEWFIQSVSISQISNVMIVFGPENQPDWYCFIMYFVAVSTSYLLCHAIIFHSQSFWKCLLPTCSMVDSLQLIEYGQTDLPMRKLESLQSMSRHQTLVTVIKKRNIEAET